MNRLYLGTKNPAKLQILTEVLQSLPLDLAFLPLGEKIPDCAESGKNAEENAMLKAKFYYSYLQAPVLALDGELFIDHLSANDQPGLYIRRFLKDGIERSDGDILAYFVRALSQLGGRSPGTWTVGMAMAISQDLIVSSSYEFRVIFTNNPAQNYEAGAPLNCIMRDPKTNRYLNEIPYRDREDFQNILSFVREHCDRL